MSDPVLLDCHFPSRLQDRITRQFAHVGRGELVDLRGTRVFFEQMGLGEVELERVIWQSAIWCSKSYNAAAEAADIPVESETLRPTRKKSLNGFRSYVKKRALLLSGLMARPICLR